MARYYTPLGRSIQKSYQDGIEAYDHDILNRFKDGEMVSADSIKHINEKKYSTASGKILYGGGGITPGVFVPFDTSLFTKPIMNIMVNGTLTKFVYKNYLRNAKQFREFLNPKQFNKNYEVSNQTLKDLKAYAQQDSVNLDINNQAEKSILEREIKIMTAREIWRTEGYYEVNNQYDSTVEKALELMKPKANIASVK